MNTKERNKKQKTKAGKEKEEKRAQNKCKQTRQTHKRTRISIMNLYVLFIYVRIIVMSRSLPNNNNHFDFCGLFITHLFCHAPSDNVRVSPSTETNIVYIVFTLRPHSVPHRILREPIIHDTTQQPDSSVRSIYEIHFSHTTYNVHIYCC